MPNSDTFLFVCPSWGKKTPKIQNNYSFSDTYDIIRLRKNKALAPGRKGLYFMLEIRDQIQALFLRLTSEQQERAVHFALSMLEAEPKEAAVDQE